MASLTDDQLQKILDYDYSQIELIPSQVKGIEENTRLILEQLQKNNDTTVELQKILMVEEVVVEEQVIEEQVIEEEVVNEEVLPVEESATRTTLDVAEEETLVEAEPQQEVLAEETVNYDQLILEELVVLNQTNSDNHLALVEHLEILQDYSLTSAETDVTFSFYMFWIIPLLLAILFFSKILNPFTRV